MENMGIIWWILPAISGVIGLLLVFAGIGRLAKLKLMTGGLRALFGVGFLGLAGIIAFAGLNLQTYKRLTKERDVATIRFTAIDNQPGTFVTTLILEGETPRTLTLKGDEFQIGAQVIKFKPMSNMLGYDSIYRIEYLQGQERRRFLSTTEVTTAEVNGVNLTENPGLDIHAFAKAEGKRFGVQDALYGSAVYNPMGDGLEYQIRITQDALIARPGNDATRKALGVANYPGNVDNQ